jgi:hypothetical protein
MFLKPAEEKGNGRIEDERQIDLEEYLSGKKAD